MAETIVAGALRTAIGRIGGTTARLRTSDRDAVAAGARLAQSGIRPNRNPEINRFNVLKAGSGKQQTAVAVWTAQFHNKRKEENHHGG